MLAIADYLDDNAGRPPAYTDVGRNRGIVYYHVTWLEKEGYVTKQKREARSIRLTDKGRAKVAAMRNNQ